MHTRSSRQKLVRDRRAREQFKQTASASRLGETLLTMLALSGAPLLRTNESAPFSAFVSSASKSVSCSFCTRQPCNESSKREGGVLPFSCTDSVNESGRLTLFSGVTSDEFSHLTLSSGSTWLSVLHFDRNPICLSLGDHSAVSSLIVLTALLSRR